MSFPQTRPTLVQRLASGGSEADWQRFLKDYWGPICRFSLRYGARNLDEAEDAAAETFEALWRQQLLVRWASNRSAKLRTLLCGVLRNILSHRNRVRAGRERKQEALVERYDRLNRPPDEHADAFYAAWVEDLVQQAVEALAAEYCRKGQVDYIRVFYGRLCQGMTIAESAEALSLSPSAVDHYFRHARDRLAHQFEALVRRQLKSYCPEEEADEEFSVEWRRLGQYLAEHGGVEEAVRRAYGLLDPVRAKRRKEAGLTRALTRLTSAMRAPPDHPI